MDEEVPWLGIVTVARGEPEQDELEYPSTVTLEEEPVGLR